MQAEGRWGVSLRGRKGPCTFEKWSESPYGWRFSKKGRGVMDTLEGSGTTPGGPVEFTPMSYMAFLILSFLEMRVLFNMLTLQP